MKRILIVRTDRVGDVVMITGVIRELRKRFPDAFIATLTQPNTKNILINNPNINVCITDDLSKESYRRVVAEIRRHKFTHGFLIMPTERAAYQMFLAGVKTRIGVGHKLYEIVTFMKSVSRNNYTPLRHEADYDMDLARKIGVVSDNYQPEIFVTDEERKEAEKLLESKNVFPGDKKIFIHTGTKGSAPNWSESKYLELIKAITQKYESDKLKIILTAFEMTPDFLEKINMLNDERIVDVSKILGNLRDLIKAISTADLFICSSTGPIHIADALQKKCIGLHCNRPMNCATHWGVINKHSINLQITKEFCDANCSNDKNTCSFENGISVAQVIESIGKLITINQKI